VPALPPTGAEPIDWLFARKVTVPVSEAPRPETVAVTVWETPTVPLLALAEIVAAALAGDAAPITPTVARPATRDRASTMLPGRFLSM
jgi:hypothetical protein